MNFISRKIKIHIDNNPSTTMRTKIPMVPNHLYLQSAVMWNNFVLLAFTISRRGYQCINNARIL